jgi:hypothetical protein
MPERSITGPMPVQPERAWTAIPVAEKAALRPSPPRSNRLNAVAAGLLRQRALLLQRALLAGKRANGSVRG